MVRRNFLAPLVRVRVPCSFSIAVALLVQSPCLAQQREFSFSDLKSAASRRAETIGEYKKDLDKAVQEIRSSPDFEKFAEARLRHLSSVWDWQAAREDKRKEAIYRSLMEEAEQQVRKQIEENAQLGRLVRLQKTREQIDADFADAGRQLTRLKSIPSNLDELDRQITALGSASAKTASAIRSAKAKNAKVTDPAQRQKNASLIEKAERYAQKTMQKIQELNAIRSNLERDLRKFAGGTSLAESQDLLKRQLSEVKKQLQLSERKLKDVNSVMDAFLFLHSLPEVTEADGVAEFRRADGTVLSAQEVKSLQPGDKITTGKSSSVATTLEDGSALRIGSSTDVEIAKPTVVDFTVTLNLGVISFSGTFHDVFGKSKAWVRKATSRRFRVRNTKAVLGVRGTQFLARVDRDGTSEVYLHSGQLKVTLNSGEVQLLSAGSYLAISKDGKPGPVRKITDEEFFSAVDRMVE